MVASKDPENDTPGPDDLYRVGVAGTVARMMKVPDGTLRILVQGGVRIRLLDYVSEQPYLVARIEEMPDVLEPSTELEALTRNVQTTFSEIIEAIPYLPEELQLAVANLDEPSALSHLIAGALRISTEEKQELLETVDVTKRLRRLSEILARELEVVQLGSKIQSQVQSEIDKSQREYFLRQQLKAIQEELGEGDEQQAEIDELRERIERGGPARGGQEGGGARALPAGEAAARRRRVQGDPHLPRLAGGPALVEADRGQPRHRPRARGPRRRPLRPRGGQGPHPRVPRRPQAQPGVARPDPLLRRPARRRQDQPRPLHRQGARPQVRAHLARRRPRRGRDPRPPPHLHRRPARDDHPGAPRRRHQEPRLHARRDRQDGRGLPRRPLQRDARGPRPGAELDLPRPLPRPAVRPLRGPLHRDGEHPRHDPAAAPGPDGGDPARRLHGRGEAPHRQALPGAAPARGERAEGRRRSSSRTRR